MTASAKALRNAPPSPGEEYNCPNQGICNDGIACKAFSEYIKTGISRRPTFEIPCKTEFQRVYGRV